MRRCRRWQLRARYVAGTPSSAQLSKINWQIALIHPSPPGLPTTTLSCSNAAATCLCVRSRRCTAVIDATAGPTKALAPARMTSTDLGTEWPVSRHSSSRSGNARQRSIGTAKRSTDTKAHSTSDCSGPSHGSWQDASYTTDFDGLGLIAPQSAHARARVMGYYNAR